MLTIGDSYSAACCAIWLVTVICITVVVPSLLEHFLAEYRVDVCWIRIIRSATPYTVPFHLLTLVPLFLQCEIQ